MDEDSEQAGDLDRAQGEVLAKALAREQAGLDTRRARAAAKAALFGKPAEHAKLDRYFLIGLLGSGATGSVYAAYDPKLDRKVALKVLSADVELDSGDTSASSDGERETRVLEAQALAQVRHPNVVQVYDAGVFDDQIYLTMELIEGQTLRAWLEGDGSRDWETSLRMLIQAGRGLAAVHAVGLVHRDFKPANVLIGDDGVARVADFGLARVELAAGEGATWSTCDAATSRGTVGAGTPAYFAPERVQGKPADARSDLFGFCVTVFEALAGERPFSDAAVRTGDYRAADRPPLPTAVPAWLRAALDRGLDPDPARRPASMDALVHELEAGLRADAARQRTKASLKRWGIGAGIAVVIGSGLYGAARVDRRTRISSCDDAAAEIDAVWPGRAQELGTAIRSSELGADWTIDKLEPLLVAWADQWRAARRDACFDGTVERTLDPQLLARAEGCLELRRAEVQGLLDLMISGDAQAIQQGVESVAGLPSPRSCADPRVLEHGTWPSAEQWNDVLEARKRLSMAESLQWVGKYEEGLAQAQSVLAEAEAVGWAPLVAMTELRIGSLHRALGHYEQAQAETNQAFFRAWRAGADDVAARAAIELTGLVGAQLGQPPMGVLWGQYAEVLLDKVDAGPRERAGLDRARAAVQTKAFHLDEARALYESALARLERALGPEHPEVATTLGAIATVRAEMGDFDESRAIHERVLEIDERALGANHPRVSADLKNLGLDHLKVGDLGRATALFERARDIIEAALGPDHPSMSDVLDNMGLAKEAQGDVMGAHALYERSLGIVQKGLGPEHPRVARTLSKLAGTHMARGDMDTGRALYERALVITQNAYGPEHPEVAGLLNNLGVVHVHTGDLEKARELLLQALPLMEKALGPDHVQLTPSLCSLGGVSLETGRTKEAVAYLERCVQIFDAHEGEQPSEYWARFDLARALVAAGGDTTRAVELARQAASHIHAEPTPDPNEKAQVEAFLSKYAR